MTDRDERSARSRLALAYALLVALVVGGLGLLADGYFARGYSAKWFAVVEGARTVVTRTTEHRVTFPNVHRPLARYLQGWPVGELPRPEQLPAIDVDLRATLAVPEGRGVFLGADAHQSAEIVVDGEPAEGRVIPPGPHDLLVRWRGRAQPHPDRGPRQHGPAHFELRWGPSPDPSTPVPAAALRPAWGPWPASRVWLAIGALLLMLSFGAATFFTARAADPSVRARRLSITVGAALVLLAVGYRAFDYDVMPEFRENADELFATWNGWSLLEDGTTRGWSLWPHAYQGRVELEEVRFFGERRPVISPYFEHPPLMHVLVGVAAQLGGAEHWLDAKLAHTRLVPIALSALAVILILAIGRRLHPRGPAPELAALLYAVIPTVALQTRVIKEEDLLVVLALGMVWFFLRWRDDGHRTRDLVLASVCAGLGMLTKVPAVVYVPALVMLVAAERGRTKQAFVAAGIGVALSASWFLFGAVIDWDAFLFTQAQQGTRPTHWSLFPRFFDATLINHNLIGRGWILFLWVGYVASVSTRGWRETAPLTVPLVTYLVAIAVGSGNWTFGWYIVPLYPFLCLGAGDFLAKLWAKPRFLPGALFVVLLVMYTLNFSLDPHLAKQPESWPGIRKMVTITVAAFLSPYALVQVWPRVETLRSLARLSTAVGLAVVVVVSGMFIARYDTGYDDYLNFDADIYFHR